MCFFQEKEVSFNFSREVFYIHISSKEKAPERQGVKYDKWADWTLLSLGYILPRDVYIKLENIYSDIRVLLKVELLFITNYPYEA